MDGEEGRIQVGEDFSIKQRDFAGNVTDQFFSTGTILTVTPQIIDYQDTTFIYLELDVERSSAQPDPVSTVISKEEASTHSLLIPGESTVIAGLYRTDRSEVRRGIPILKDLPAVVFWPEISVRLSTQPMFHNQNSSLLIQAELEDSIPERISRSLRSKQEALDEQKIRHREDMDYIPGEGFERGLFEEASLETETESVEPERVIPDEPEPVQEPEIEQEETPVC
jgi:general secretion pathway protein D